MIRNGQGYFCLHLRDHTEFALGGVVVRVLDLHRHFDEWKATVRPLLWDDEPSTNWPEYTTCSLSQIEKLVNGSCGLKAGDVCIMRDKDAVVFADRKRLHLDGMTVCVLGVRMQADTWLARYQPVAWDHPEISWETSPRYLEKV